MKNIVTIIFAVVISLSPMTYVSASEQSVAEQSDIVMGITSETRCETLDDQAFDYLRSYYNDETLSEDDLFNRFVELKKSYITALDNLYTTNTLAFDSISTETAMHIFYEGQETLFGQDSSVFLYNIATYRELEKSEQTSLVMIIPVRSTNSVITVSMMIPHDQPGEQTADDAAAILSDIAYDGLTPQQEAPAVLKDIGIMEKVKAGIYPAADQETPNYVTISDNLTGYSVSLPDSYVPSVQNKLGGTFTYTGYKIDPNRILSISSELLYNQQESAAVSSEPLYNQQESAAISSELLYNQQESAAEAIERFNAAAPDTVAIIESGDALFGGNDFKYIFYSDTKHDVQKYYYDYYLQGSTRLYKIQLQSRFSEPGTIILRQLEKILTGFHANETAEMPGKSATSKMAANAVVRSDPSAVVYENREEGYCFKYPSAWTLEDISPNIDYDHLRLSIPGHSGTLEITFQESAIPTPNESSTPTPNENSVPTPDENGAPFSGKTSKLLFSDYVIDGSVTTTYRLGVFIDDNGRNRLYYCTDILKGKKIYSMCITSGEYRTRNGIFDDERINRMINMVASSFHMKDTPESEARTLAGETRNRKLVFVENELRNLYGSRLTVLPAENTQPDGTTIVYVENTDESGYYKIRLDYTNKQVEVLERILKKDILLNELKYLREQFDGLTITSTYRSVANMTISIESFSDKNNSTGRNSTPDKSNPADKNSASDKSSAADKNNASDKNNSAGRNSTPDKKRETVMHTYAVNVKPVNGKIIWNTVKVAAQKDYIEECKAFVKSKFASDVDVHIFSNNAFNNVDAYFQKGVDYRVLAFYQGSGRSGFFLLSMNPVTGEFTAQKSFIPLAHIIENIKYKYGIKEIGTASGLYCFDPETFVLSVFTSANTAYAGHDQLESSGTDKLSPDIHKFNVYYHLETDQIQFEMINPPLPDKH